MGKNVSFYVFLYFVGEQGYEKNKNNLHNGSCMRE